MARGPNGWQRHTQAVRARGFTPLRRALRVPVWGDLGARLFAALFLVSIVVAVHWLDRDGLKDSHDGSVSFLDVDPWPVRADGTGPKAGKRADTPPDTLQPDTAGSPQHPASPEN